jgi:hypothetical protein
MESGGRITEKAGTETENGDVNLTERPIYDILSKQAGSQGND